AALWPRGGVCYNPPGGQDATSGGVLRGKAAIFASAFVIGLSGAMMPGPLLTTCVGTSLEQGFWAGGPLLVLGHAALELALLALVLAGLGPVLSRRKVGAGIGLVGGAVLLWMAGGMLALAVSGPEAPAGGEAGALWSNPVVAGAAVSLANPYWSLWWATIGLKYVALSRQAGAGGLACFYCGHQLSDAAWYVFVAGAVALGRRAIAGAAYAWLLGACGAVLLGFGLAFVAGGARTLWRVRTAKGGP
ncbi:MAG: LysE family transporter, partial [bacterium]